VIGNIIIIIIIISTATLCIVLAFYCCDKIPERNQLKGKRFTLAHDFRGLSSWLLVPITLGLRFCAPHGGQEEEEERLIL
jgi:hypothetical protein